MKKRGILKFIFLAISISVATLAATSAPSFAGGRTCVPNGAGGVKCFP